jgi:hypothetical protein
MSFSFNEPSSTHPTAETTVETPNVPDVTVVPDVVPPVESITEPEASAPSTGDPGGTDTPGVVPPSETTPATTTETPEPVSYYFGGEEVSIDVDASHREAFEAKGLDIDALAGELYSKEGGFQLSSESYQKCCDAFGKFAIDAFIGGLKSQNEATVSGWKNELESRERADTERYTNLSSTIGGDEGWSRLEEYALATLSDDELKGFNEVMGSGNQYLQEFAIRELEGRRKGAQGDDSVELIEGDASRGASEGGGPLSGADYIREIASLGQKYPNDKAGYAKAQEALTARRRAGMSSGI